MFYRILPFLPTLSSKFAYLHLAKYLHCISVVLIYYVIFTDGALADEQTPADTEILSADCIPSERRTLADDTTHVHTAVSTTGCATSEQKTLVDDLTRSDNSVCVADCTMSEQSTLTDEMTPDDSAVSVSVCTAYEQNNFPDEMAPANTAWSVSNCKMSEQNTLADGMLPVDSAVPVADCTLSDQNTLSDEMTHADTGVSVANCIRSEQGSLADNPPPATNDVLLTACGLITLVGDMSRVVSSSSRSAKQTANIINEAQCMYSSSNSEVVSVDDSDYIPSDCSFVCDSDACSTGRSVEIPLLPNTTNVLDTSETVTLPNRKRNRTN